MRRRRTGLSRPGGLCLQRFGHVSEPFARFGSRPWHGTSIRGRSFVGREKFMSALGSVIFVVLGFNALLSTALIFRRSRPKLRARMFSWLVHTKPSRQAREQAHRQPA
jgi:hypothetical protein